MNWKVRTLLIASKVFIVSILLLFVSEFVSPNTSLLVSALQLVFGTLVIIHVPVLFDRLASRDEREHG